MTDGSTFDRSDYSTSDAYKETSSPSGNEVAGGGFLPAIIKNSAAISTESQRRHAAFLEHTASLNLDVGRMSDLRVILETQVFGQIRWDTFTERAVAFVSGELHSIEDHDLTQMLSELETLGLGTTKRQTLSSTVELIAKQNPYDSAQWFLDQLPVWDKNSRLEYFLPKYLGTTMGRYQRAVSRYIWTAMVARILKPGCQADMVPVLVGPSGSRKSTAVQTIAPSLDFYAEANVADSRPGLAHKLFGKTLVEWSDLRGIKGRVDSDQTKAFISSSVIEFRNAGRRGTATIPRRFIVLGTSCRFDFLRDPTGHRRYLPFKVGKIDVEQLEADKLQIWAEALALVRDRQVRGLTLIDYLEAESLAPQEHQAFVDQGRWVDDETLISWLKGGADKFRTDDALKTVGLGPSVHHSDRREMIKTLRQLGYEQKPCHLSGLPHTRPKRWRKI